MPLTTASYNAADNAWLPVIDGEATGIIQVQGIGVVRVYIGTAEPDPDEPGLKLWHGQLSTIREDFTGTKVWIKSVAGTNTVVVVKG